MNRETAIRAGRKEHRTAARRDRRVNRPVDRRRVERLAIPPGAEPFHIEEPRVVSGSWSGCGGGLPALCLAVGERRSAQRDKQNKKDKDGRKRPVCFHHYLHSRC